MQQSLVAAVDWKRRWVYCVVCAPNGVEVTRVLWPLEEAADHMIDYLNRQREKHGIPVVVTGRSGAWWPNSLLEALWVSGFMVELYEGAPLGSLLRHEHHYRENQTYRTASLLAAVHSARHREGGVGELDTFVLQWAVQQARHRVDELALELESSRPQWDERGTELGPWTSLRPAVFSNLVRMSVLPL
jgi:hypothetical protein